LALLAPTGACGDDANEFDMTGTTPNGAATNGETSTAGAATATTAGGDPEDPDDPIGILSDDFDDPGSLVAWNRREAIEGGDGYIDRLAVEDGRLRLRPTASGWYAGYMGPMLFKRVAGDFAIETSVRAASLSSTDTAPTQLFNAGGLIVRDPGSVNGAQNWITHNVGRQQPEVGTEGKDTRDSASHLELVDGVHHGTLRICRIGSTFILARRLDNEGDLREMHRFERPDLPETLQVGMMANGWNSADEHPDTSVAPDVEVSFDYVRFWRPRNPADCLAP
jgi:hypothetical protein